MIMVQTYANFNFLWDILKHEITLNPQSILEYIVTKL